MLKAAGYDAFVLASDTYYVDPADYVPGVRISDDPARKEAVSFFLISRYGGVLALIQHKYERDAEGEIVWRDVEVIEKPQGVPGVVEPFIDRATS